MTEHIWAPWRVEYIQAKKTEGCILCDKPKENNDEANYIIFRGKYNFVIMNSYPYNPGHLMVAPFRHVATPEDLPVEELHEHSEMVRRCLTGLRKVYSPAGFNTGMNLGKVAGAGIDSHIHSHIVPRWQGDTNFMPVIGNIRVIPQALADMYGNLKPEFQEVMMQNEEKANWTLTQVGVVVKDVEQVAKRLVELGIGPFQTMKLPPEREELFRGKPALADAKIMGAAIGNMQLELIQPMAISSPHQEYLEAKGEGIQHIMVAVDDIEKELKRLTDKGCTILLDIRMPGGRHGAYIDLNAGGIIVEMFQKNPEAQK
jgi:ATP adenylyltransferase